jgi:hypothetical protein
VYSETLHFLPIVGTASSKSRVCYIKGSNACDQSTLSYSSSLVPGLLGYKDGAKLFVLGQRECLSPLQIKSKPELNTFVRFLSFASFSSFSHRQAYHFRYCMIYYQFYTTCLVSIP